MIKKGYRTIIVNAATAVVAVGAGVIEYMHVIEFPREVLIGAIVVVNLGNVYLRSITTTPVGKDI